MLPPPSPPGRTTSLRGLLRALIPAGAVAIALLGIGSAAQAKPSPGQIQQQISAKSDQLEKIVEQYNELNIALTRTRADIKALRAELAPLAERADAAHADVAEIAGTAYRTGMVRGWKALLSATDGDSALSRLAVLHRLAQSQQLQLTAARQSAAQRFAVKKALDEQLASASTRARTLRGQRKGIEADLVGLQALKRESGAVTASSGSSRSGSIPKISGKAGVAVAYAYKALGTPYVWAAEGPSGYDCSGLTLAAWRAAGVTLYHNAAAQWDEVTHLSRSQLAPGDLVFYSDLGHVALYVGDGKVIHAPTFGESVKVSQVDMMTPYGYGRVKP